MHETNGLPASSEFMANDKPAAAPLQRHFVKITKCGAVRNRPTLQKPAIMKNFFLFNICLTALFLTAALSVIAQTPWNHLLLTGANAKIIPAIHQPRINIGLTGAFPLGSVADQNIEFAALQNAAFAPGTFEQLFEKLGGEFFIGNPSSQPTQTVGLTGRTQAMPGLRLGVRLGNRFELRAAAQHFRAEWSGEFPVFVFPQFSQDYAQPKTLMGRVNASLSAILLDVGGAFFIGNGAIKPYLEGGVRGLLPTQTESGAEIAGVSLPLETEQAGTSFSPFGGAGLRCVFLKNGFVEAGCSFGKLSGGDYQPVVGVGVGWGF